MILRQRPNVFVFGRQSLRKLLVPVDGVYVHPHMVAVAQLALQITTVDFGIFSGVRSLKQQQREVDKGASWTLDSRHRTGHAIDTPAWVDGKYSWEKRHLGPVCEAFAMAAEMLRIPLAQGRNWTKVPPDWAHQELPRRHYPAR